MISVMDVDLLVDILNEAPPALSGNLLSHLSDRSLTNNEPVAQVSNFIPICLEVIPDRAGAVVTKIEDIFENVTGCILDEKKEMVIKLKTRCKQATKSRDAHTGTIKSLPDDETRVVKFPSKSPKEAWKFSE